VLTQHDAIPAELCDLITGASPAEASTCSRFRELAAQLTDQLAAQLHAQPPLTPEQYDAELVLIKEYLASLLPKGSKAAVR
jgi:hypothetical protein